MAPRSANSSAIDASRIFSRTRRCSQAGLSWAEAPITCRKSAACAPSILTTRSWGCGSRSRASRAGLTSRYTPFGGRWTAPPPQPRWANQPLHPEQRISREQAIRLYTINNAWLTFEEKEKGSLEPGKLADLIEIGRAHV